MKILLGVTGSIAAYKTYDLAREWVKRGHEVKIIYTSGAEKLIQTRLFNYLGIQDVYGPQDDFAKENANKILHIELAKWCDRLIICPLSANTLAKLAQGIADDLLTTTALALDHKPVILYPAMNTNMLLHPITQENLKKMTSLPFVFVHPTEEGRLACGDFGQGKLPQVEHILDLAPYVRPYKSKTALKIVITAGATISPLDPVRYMTNPASGISGLYFAQAFIEDGHEVILIAGKNASPRLDALKAVPYCKLIRVTTPKDMELAVMDNISGADAFIASAAVGDLEFELHQAKIKKEGLEGGSLPYKKTTDILKRVLQEKSKLAPHLKTIGFAAETDTAESIFQEKWQRKPVDLLIGNPVNNGLVSENPTQGFGADSNHYYFVKEGKIVEDKPLSKTELAQEIKAFILKK